MKRQELLTPEKPRRMNDENTFEKSQTDWARIDAMTDDEIDLSDCPEITEDMWAKAVRMKNGKPIPKKNQENLPIDRDIIEFLKARGYFYPLKINEILRAYMEAEQAK